MNHAGQYLIDPTEFFGWFNIFGIAAVILMAFVLYKLHSLLVALEPKACLETYGKGLAVGGVLSVLSTLLLTCFSYQFFGAVASFTGSDIKPQVANAAGIDESQFQTATSTSSETSNSMPTGAIVKGLSKGARNRWAGLVMVIVGLLLVIGTGYAFTAFELGFGGDFAAMSAGVALPEELTKAAAGLAILYFFFQTQGVSETRFRRSVLAAFGIAGLGFGAIEALKYFGAYASADAGIFYYIVRAVWCVTLHGSWTLIFGAILGATIPRTTKELEKNGKEFFYAALWASAPTVIAHGLYNTCCTHVGLLVWVVGGASIGVAFLLIRTHTADDCHPVEESPQPQAY